jgi:hypothetical protein
MNELTNIALLPLFERNAEEVEAALVDIQMASVGV